jgi:hypothetical protein
MKPMERQEKRIMHVSAVWYTGTSLLVVALFVGLAKTIGGYPAVAVYGGAMWAFLLSMIVTMPLFTSYFKRRGQG